MKDNLVASENKFKNNSWSLLQFFGAAFVIFFIWTAFNPFADHLQMGLFTMACWSLGFLLYDWRGKQRNSFDFKVSWFDWIFVILSVLVCSYFMLNYEELMVNLGNLSQSDRIAGSVAILLALEASRRAIGLAVSSVAAILLLYCLYSGLSFDQVVTRSFLGDVGIYGSVADIFARYILLFIVFGALLESSGAINLLNAFVSTAAKKYIGGAAKAAVAGSAVMGGIVGSSSANVAVTGIVTIPVMIAQGYKRHRAAAIETAAGLGGEISPPIMGAAAFLVCANTGTQYADLMIIAVMPAIIYYLSIYFSIDLEARRDREHLSAMSLVAEKEKNKVSDYIHLLLAPVVLVTVVLVGYSPTYAGGLGIISVILLSMIRKKTRLSLRELLNSLANGAFSFIPLGATAGALGLIMVATIVSGISNEFANWTTTLNQGSLIILIVVVLFLSLVLGLGLPIVASYMILATVCGPGLQAFGIPILSAHLLMLWFVQTAAISPPSALAAQISANIAGTGFYKTCWASMWLCIPFYIVPLWFVYSDLITGDLLHRSLDTLIISTGFLFLAAASSKYLLGNLNKLELIFIWPTAILFLIPSKTANILGIAFLIIVLFYFFFKIKKKNHKKSSSSDRK